MTEKTIFQLFSDRKIMRKQLVQYDDNLLSKLLPAGIAFVAATILSLIPRQIEPAGDKWVGVMFTLIAFIAAIFLLVIGWKLALKKNKAGAIIWCTLVSWLGVIALIAVLFMFGYFFTL